MKPRVMPSFRDILPAVDFLCENQFIEMNTYVDK